MKGNFLKDKNNNYETFVALINSNNKILNEDFEKSGVFNFKDIEKAIKSVLYWARVFKFYKKNKVEDKVDTIKSSPEYQLTQLHDDFVIEIKNFNFKDACIKYNVDCDFEPLDFYKIILSRVWKNIIEMDFDPKNKYEWQESNKNITSETRLRGRVFEDSEENLEALNEVLNETKLAVVLYRFIHSCLQKRLNKIKEFENKLKIRYSVESSVLELIIAQTHATLYANYFILMGVLGETGHDNSFQAITKEFPDFLYHELYLVANVIKKQDETEE